MPLTPLRYRRCVELKITKMRITIQEFANSQDKVKGSTVTEYDSVDFQVKKANLKKWAACVVMVILMRGGVYSIQYS
jgi:hypothetical protein